jgi:GcrA cell cycle regulator
MAEPRASPGKDPGAPGKGIFMQSMSWTPEQSLALREYLAAGLSFSRAADALNARFGGTFTRSAVIGRARRMKLPVCAPPERGPRPPKAKKITAAKVPVRKSHDSRAGGAKAAAPPPKAAEPVKLRCVGIQPRLVGLDELGEADCRYPYGGDREGEPITFCGHPRYRGSSYCAPHFHLTRGPRVEPERPTGPFVLRLIEAA